VTEALVLRAVDFGESDRIAHLLTPDAGRLTAIAKGAKRSRRRFPGTLDVFNLLRVQVAPRRRPGALARLEQAQLVDWHPGLRDRPARFALACYLVELLDRLAPEGAGGPEAARLFRFASEALQAVEAAAPDARLRALLELRALEALGLRPELAACVRCGGEPDAFHVAEGGALCARCAAAVPGALAVRRGTLRALEQALRLPLSHLGRLGLAGAALAEAADLVARFQRFHIGVELRSERFLRQQLAGNSSKSHGSSG
jgi:DNA repair protein RecO (recombination protein O)